MENIQSYPGLVSVASHSTYSVLGNVENILLKEAFPLLDYICLFKQSKFSQVDDVIKNKVVDDIIKYQNRIQSGNYSKDICDLASYCLCAAIDESVLENLESMENAWVSETLLCSFHHDTWGGERVFEIYSQARQDCNSDLVNLIFIIISLGFTGKYFDNSLELSAIRKQIYPDSSDDLSALESLIHPVTAKQYNFAQHASILIASIAVLLVLWSILNVGIWYAFKSKTSHINQDIEELRKVESV